MSVISVKVPISGGDLERSGWCENISQHIDAGNDVKFVDIGNGADVEISRIQLDTDGTVNFRGAGYADNETKALAFVAGGFHRVGGIHKIFASGTTASIGIHAKI